MVRLQDIAARAQVSVMTVSKALRDAPDISANTKARIKLLAQQMGYVPDSVARGLRNRKSNLFGLIIPSSADPFFARVAAAIQEAAFEAGYDVIVSHTTGLIEREEACIRRLLSRRVDGIFIAPVNRLGASVTAYDELARRRLPVVILGHRSPFCAPFVSAEPDDLTASQNATRYLIEIGHRRIAFFTGPLASASTAERIEGYRRALREARLEPDDHLIFSAGDSMADGEKAALQLLNEKTDPTAVQTFNDLVAIGAANIFLKQGIKIPEDLSLVGFGNILIAEYFRVPLTTVRQPKLRLGIAAVELMLKLVRGERAEARRLPAELIIRASTAPPKLSGHPGAA
jgi:DNA-binding LacI/PurR family transcriptional regulator